MRYSDGGRSLLHKAISSLFISNGDKQADTILSAIDVILRRLVTSAVKKRALGYETYFRGLAKATRALATSAVYVRSRIVTRPKRKQVTTTDNRGRVQKKIETIMVTGRLSPKATENKEYLTAGEKKAAIAYNETLKHCYAKLDAAGCKSLGEFGELADCIVSSLFEVTDRFNGLVKKRKTIIRNTARAAIIEANKGDRKFDTRKINIDPASWAKAQTEIMSDHETRTKESRDAIRGFTVTGIRNADTFETIVELIRNKPGWGPLFN